MYACCCLSPKPTITHVESGLHPKGRETPTTAYFLAPAILDSSLHKDLTVSVRFRRLSFSCFEAQQARRINVLRSKATVRAKHTSGRSEEDKERDGAGVSQNYLAREGTKLFADEVIGAEHGEGFSTFRSQGHLHVDVEFLNDRMKSRGLQRIRYAMKPDEAFGLIFSWDNVLADTKSLRLEALRLLAEEEGREINLSPELKWRLVALRAEDAVQQVFGWQVDKDKCKLLMNRLAQLYCEELAKVRAPREGVLEWLEALGTAGVPCAVASSMDRLTLLATLERMQLRHFFRAFVTEEDGMDSIAHQFLSAAVKLDRPPAKCVVFEDDPLGITAAHNCSMKAVALIGRHPAYELQQADLTVKNFRSLSVINLRRLFAARGLEFMDLKKQEEDKEPARRKLRNDTYF